ncbi:hypothetical protein [Amphibacillus jilinensis]|uniref:hypothetical protein n=1 Tax=Amphibacillus jilinensis TaxID=1216008 RepID=UPI00031A60EC|nr:hypothetical protein [Amphibacillus jilinensis]
MKDETKRYLKITIIFFIILTSIRVYLMIERNNTIKEMEAQDQLEMQTMSELFPYRNAEMILHMDSVYHSEQSPVDVELIATDRTLAMLERWEAVAAAYPTLEYPEDEIDQGDWLDVVRIFQNQSSELRAIEEEMFADVEEEGILLRGFVLKNYINNDTDNELILSVLRENGIK